MTSTLISNGPLSGDMIAFLRLRSARIIRLFVCEECYGLGPLKPISESSDGRNECGNSIFGLVNRDCRRTRQSQPIKQLWSFAGRYSQAHSKFWNLSTVGQLSGYQQYSTDAGALRGSSSGETPNLDTAVKKKRTRKAYSKEDIETFLWLRNHGYRWKVIAETLQRPRQSVVSYWHQFLQHKGIATTSRLPEPAPLKPSGSLWTPEENQMLDHLKSEGLGQKAIAQRLGRSNRAVYEHTKQYFRNGARDVKYEKVRSIETDVIGRKKRVPYSNLEALTVYYLRIGLGQPWREIAELFPNRHKATLQRSFSRRLRWQYEGLVDSDPRQWSDDKVQLVASLGKDAAARSGASKSTVES